MINEIRVNLHSLRARCHQTLSNLIKKIKVTQTALKPASILSNPLIINNIREIRDPWLKTHQTDTMSKVIQPAARRPLDSPRSRR